MKLKYIFIKLFLFLLLSSKVFSAPIYQVELIIFSQIKQNTFNAEQWSSQNNGVLNLKNALELSKTMQPFFYALPKNQWILQWEAMKLKRAGYPILVHTAWKQPLNPHTQQIHLYGGEFYNNPSTWQVNGIVSINAVHYFDINFNLYFAEPTQRIKIMAQTPLVYFHLMESRRTRSGELNYLDHPFYGILLKIKKIA